MVASALANPFEFTDAGWSVSVAYPGETWKRVDCSGWCWLPTALDNGPALGAESPTRRRRSAGSGGRARSEGGATAALTPLRIFLPDGLAPGKNPARLCELFLAAVAWLKNDLLGFGVDLEHSRKRERHLTGDQKNQCSVRLDLVDIRTEVAKRNVRSPAVAVSPMLIVFTWATPVPSPEKIRMMTCPARSR